MSNGGFMITGDQTKVFHYLQVASALALEVNLAKVTGEPVKHSQGSVMNVAKRECGSPKRTKRGVLCDYVAWLKNDILENYEPNPRVLKAMKK